MNNSEASLVRHEDSPSDDDAIKVDDRWSIAIQRFDVPLHDLEQVFTQEHLAKIRWCSYTSYVGRNHISWTKRLDFFQGHDNNKKCKFSFHGNSYDDDYKDIIIYPCDALSKTQIL